MIDPEFIKRAKEVVAPRVEESILYDREIHQRWQKKNREAFRQKMKDYEQTPAGKKSLKRKYLTRYWRMKYAALELTENEKFLVDKFYENCPKGYEVDHIIPIARGGSHKIENLQYLTRMENRIKAWKLIGKKIDVQKLL